MGFTKKKISDSGMESDGKKWVIAGISIKSLKPINTKPRDRASRGDNIGEEEERSTTPTAKEARIPEKLACPPAPRKRRPPPSSSRCNYTVAREFFTPPDLDSVFKRYVEKAN